MARTHEGRILSETLVVRALVCLMLALYGAGAFHQILLSCDWSHGGHHSHDEQTCPLCVLFFASAIVGVLLLAPAPARGRREAPRTGPSGQPAPPRWLFPVLRAPPQRCPS